MKPHARLLRIFASIIPLLLLLGGSARAQGSKEITVTGKVTDSQNEALPGAVVIINGTVKGVQVGEDGTYSIQVPKNGTLDVSLMGFSTVSEFVDGRTIINFKLKEDSVRLKEAVVEVGYGSERVSDSTGSVGSFDIDNFDAGAMSFDESLQGRLAGVLVTGGDGQPGSELDMIIRGGGSLTQSNAPLYVVDGFPMEDFSAASVNASDIASISVLKDASATAIYGSRGSNGVVIIQTKAGKMGKPTISYDGVYGVISPIRTIELMTPLEFVEYQIERSASNYNKYLTNEGRDLDYYRTCEDIDWQGRLFSNASFNKHTVSLLGGNRQTRYQASISYTGQNGVIENSGVRRYQGRFSLEQKMNNRMRVFVQGSFHKNSTDGQSASASMQDGQSYSNYLMYRIWGAIPVVTGGKTIEDLFDENSDVSFTINPIVSNRNEIVRTDSRQFSINGRVEYMLTKRIKMKPRVGFTYTGTETNNFYNSKTYTGYARATNSYGVQGNIGNRHNESWLFEDTFEYARRFNKGTRINATFGVTAQGWNNHFFRVSAVQINDDTVGMAGIDSGIMQNPNYTASESRMLSALMRVNYVYHNRYMFTFTGRADGSSRFVPGHRWGVFPSGAVAWRVGQEKAVRRIKWIDDAKLRLSYGLTGNNRVGDFMWADAITYSDYYGWGGVAPSRIAVPVRLGNRDLSWETATQLDAGLDLYTLGSRLNLKLDYYRKVSSNLLLNAQLPSSSGYVSAYRNSGAVCNSGLELTLSSVNIRKRNFMWTTDFNITFQRDRVLELYDGMTELYSAVPLTADFRATDLYVARVGGPVASFWGLEWDGCYGYSDFTQQADGSWLLNADVPTNGNPRETIQPGDIKYKDRNGDLVCDERDATVIGRCSPIHYGGFTNTFTWRNWTFTALLQWNYGNDIMNANRYIFEGNYADSTINQYRTYADRWSDDNQDASNFRVGGFGPRGVYSSRTIEDGSYLRLKSVKLTYKLPLKVLQKVKVQSAQVYVSGFNLITWSRYSGFDPEVSIRKTALTPGLDYCSYPRSRSWSCGLKVSF